MLWHVSEFPSLLKLNNIPSYGYTTFSFFTFDGHLGCFYFLAITDNAAVNMGVQISLQDPDFNPFGYIPRSGTAGSYGSSIFCGTLVLFSIAAAPFSFPPSGHESSSSSPSSPTHFFVLFVFVFYSFHIYYLSSF